MTQHKLANANHIRVLHSKQNMTCSTVSANAYEILMHLSSWKLKFSLVTVAFQREGASALLFPQSHCAALVAQPADHGPLPIHKP